MANDPREPQGERQQNNPEPPSNSNPRPAPGGVGTGTEGDPADDKDAQPKKENIYDAFQEDK